MEDTKKQTTKQKWLRVYQTFMILFGVAFIVVVAITITNNAKALSPEEATDVKKTMVAEHLDIPEKDILMVKLNQDSSQDIYVGYTEKTAHYIQFNEIKQNQWEIATAVKIPAEQTPIINIEN